MPPPLNLTINLYERVHLCPDRRALSIKIQPPSVKRAAELDFQPLKVIWGYRLVPEVGPGFRVFKEESFVCKERKKQPEWKIERGTLLTITRKANNNIFKDNK